MSTNIFDEPVLNTWVAALRSRGITVGIRKNRLSVQPWKQLTTEDQATIRAHRAAIKNYAAKNIVQSESLRIESRRIESSGTESRGTESESRIAPPALPPAQAQAQVAQPKSPVIDPEVLRIINWRTPEERERRSREATEVALHMMRRKL